MSIIKDELYFEYLVFQLPNPQRTFTFVDLNVQKVALSEEGEKINK